MTLDLTFKQVAITAAPLVRRRANAERISRGAPVKAIWGTITPGCERSKKRLYGSVLTRGYNHVIPTTRFQSGPFFWLQGQETFLLYRASTQRSRGKRATVWGGSLIGPEYFADSHSIGAIHLSVSQLRSLQSIFGYSFRNSSNNSLASSTCGSNGLSSAATFIASSSPSTISLSESARSAFA